MGWIHRIICAYMVATTMHLPFPVFDGDNLRSGELSSNHEQSTNDTYDVDFIFLGCDPPDDSDDGPIDDDPENGSLYVFGQIFISHNPISKLSSQDNPYLKARGWDSSSPPDWTIGTGPQPGIHFRYFSFGKLCRYGVAHLRC